MRAAILGTGLIGSSAGLGLTELGWEVIGWDPDERALAAAGRRGAVVAAAASSAEAIVGADLVLLAGPPEAVIAGLGELATEALVTDVAGVKRPVVDAARHLARFVGGHPMAGREHAGPESASGALFRGAAWVLCSDGAGSDALEEVSALVEALGARPVVMTAEEHDRAIGLISHVPQILAAALLAGAEEDPGALELAAGSFRDLTRVALSEPGWWSEILIANAEGVAADLRRLAAALGGWADLLTEGDREAAEARLGAARDLRRHLAPPVVAVEVTLLDRPGEIAAVGRALAISKVDVRDLQLRHAPHGGGGVLTVSVRPGEAAALRHALLAEGFPEVE